MSSMNNWLAFSLSPQELTASSSSHHLHHFHHHQENDHSSSHNNNHNNGGGGGGGAGDGGLGYEISNTTDLSFHLNNSVDSTTPLGPLSILEVFNRNNHSSHHHQDWNNSDSEANYKSASDQLSMIMDTSCNNQNLETQEPKLENFLGGHSFSNNSNHRTSVVHNSNNNNTAIAAYDSSNTIGEGYNIFPSSESSSLVETTGSSSNGIGLSMIKTWLRSNQTAATAEVEVCGNNKTLTSAPQTLSLSMSGNGGSQSSNSALPLLTGGRADGSSSDTEQPKAVVVDSQSGGGAVETTPRKSVETFGQRTSIYRGVTRHRWTGRYEAHLWDNSCRREGQTRKGRQVYLGGYDKEEKAARAYDLAALKYWGATTTTNFPVANYEKEIEEMKHMTRQEYIASLRRKSSGFSRGASMYRGVTRHHQHGRWQARIGRVAGNKDLYLGTFSTQEEAAEAYDIAAIKFRGLNAVTNFEMSRYDVKSILESSSLPIGGAAKRLKDADQQVFVDMTTTLHNGILSQPRARDDQESIISSDGINQMGWPTVAFHHQSNYGNMHPYYSPYGRVWCKQEIQDSSTSDNNSNNQTFNQDFHQLQLGNNGTHNFFHQHNNNNPLVSMESSSGMEETNNGSNNSAFQLGYNNGGGYMMPMNSSSIMGLHEGNSHNVGGGYNGDNNDQVKAVLGYGETGMYYPSPQQSQVRGYDQGSGCNSWVPTHGGGVPAFTVWNDA